jgi:hypothetical protein
MKILIVYLKKDDKLKRCLKSLEGCKYPVVLKQADPSKTKVCEEVIQEYMNSEECDDDVMIWHPDMMAIRGWDTVLEAYKDKFDVVGMKILYPNGIVNHYGGAIRADGVGFHPHQFSLDIGCDMPLNTAFVTGPGMIIKEKVWDKVKSFDFQFQHYIDVDFCFNARKNGFSVGVVPVPVIHWEGEDGFKKRDPEIQQKMLQEYHAKFVAKWLIQNEQTGKTETGKEE